MLIRTLLILTLCLLGINESMAEFKANTALQQLRFDRVLMEQYSDYGGTTHKIEKVDNKQLGVAFSAAERVFDLVVFGRHDDAAALPDDTKIEVTAKDWKIRNMTKEESDNNVAEFMAVSLGMATDLLDFKAMLQEGDATLKSKIDALKKHAKNKKLQGKEHVNVAASIVKNKLGNQFATEFTDIFKSLGAEKSGVAQKLLKGNEGFNVEFADKESQVINNYDFENAVEFEIPEKVTPYNLGLYSDLYGQISNYRREHIREQLKGADQSDIPPIRVLSTYMRVMPRSDVAAMSKLIKADAAGNRYSGLFSRGVYSAQGYTIDRGFPSYIKDEYIAKKKNESEMWARFDADGNVEYSFYQGQVNTGGTHGLYVGEGDPYPKLHYNKAPEKLLKFGKKGTLETSRPAGTNLSIYADILDSKFDLSGSEFTGVNVVANKIDIKKTELKLPFEHLRKSFIYAKQFAEPYHTAASVSKLPSGNEIEAVANFIKSVALGAGSSDKDSEIGINVEGIKNRIPDYMWDEWTWSKKPPQEHIQENNSEYQLNKESGDDMLIFERKAKKD